ncbi:MAG: nitroreductase family protein [Bacteroidales bacterium]|nr:nitroreductase family protein [Bacteroidales bacterium]
MADNYLEKRQQELAERRPKVVHPHPSLESLLKRNRSYRGFDHSHPVTEADLLRLLEVVPWVGSGMNAQPLRFKLVTGPAVDLVHPLITLGSALPDEHLPHPGEEPQAYIVVCSAAPVSRAVDIDLGIAAQSILLRAVENGLGGIFVLNFRAAELKAALALPLAPIALIGIGKPLERIFLIPASEGDSLAYYRKDGAHFVPKLGVKDLLL